MQVSTEYGSFKREAEVKMQELQQDRDQAREELQLAMVAGSVSRHLFPFVCAAIYWYWCTRV